VIDKIFDFGFKDIFNSLPKEYVTLTDAVKGKTRISLGNGITHEMKKTELDKLSSKIPVYMWSMVKIPFLVIKTENVGEYLISGSDWQKRAISFLVERDVEFLSTVDVERLIREYRSIIFISLTNTSLHLDEGV